MRMPARSQNSRPPRLRTYVLVLALLIGGPALALGLPASLRIPILAPPHPTGEPPDAALFSHWQHDSFGCTACHPSTFPQRKLGFTHDDMNRGLYCGSCHDGRLAFSPRDKGIECETCHVPTKPPPEIDEDDLW
jgi:c(7)-type cytochrome triheme protein